jgi:hypothetical protein
VHGDGFGIAVKILEEAQLRVSVSLARAWLAKNSTGNCRSAWRS